MNCESLCYQYADKIMSAVESGFDGAPLPSELLMAEDHRLAIYYAPFDYVNVDAKLVIVGITPGLQQARLALSSMRVDLLKGVSVENSLRNAKLHASFGGAMRTNLVNLMDYLDINGLLDIATTASLFTTASSLVHFTSVLRYPVFINGKNYSGAPHPFKAPLLKNALSFFLSEVESLRNALFLPVGKLPNDILTSLIKSGSIPAQNVLLDVPHPSGANQERVNYFLGKKPRDTLSPKTNPEKIDKARADLSTTLAHYRDPRH